MNYEKAIVNVKAFLPNDNEIIKIIEICNLNPLKDDWRNWIDNSDFNLNIRKDHNIYIYKNIPNKQSLIIKDIHFKAPIDVISNNSKFALILFSYKQQTDICYVWFLGNDDNLRLCLFVKNEWVENRSPLMAGIGILRTIVNNMNVEKHKTVLVKSILNEISWATKWPPTNKMILDMMLTYQPLAKSIVDGCKLIGE